MQNILFINLLFSQLSIGLTLAQLEKNSDPFVEADSLRIVNITLIDYTFAIGTILDKSDTSILFKSLSNLVFKINIDRIKEIDYINRDSLVAKRSTANP